jgi:hypothetical protein
MAPADSSTLYRLTYVSTAVGVLPASELDRILLRSRVSNAGSDVTGLLLFHEGSFLQVIEGPAAGVMTLMEKIRRDRRHANVQVLESGPVSARAFPNQPLNYLAPRHLSVDDRSGFADLLAIARASFAPKPAPAHDLATTLWSFLAAFRNFEPAPAR